VEGAVKKELRFYYTVSQAHVYIPRYKKFAYIILCICSVYTYCNMHGIAGLPERSRRPLIEKNKTRAGREVFLGDAS